MATPKPAPSLWEMLTGRRMTPTEHLLKTRLFRGVIAGPLAFAAVLMVIGISNSNLTGDPTFTGFNKFVELFKLPIGVASLSIPLGALVASHHRSVQAASQIKAQESQNVFSNFIQHKEYFGKYIDEEEFFSGDFSFRAKDKKIYQALFPKAQRGNRELILSEQQTARVEKELVNLDLKVRQLTWKERSTFPEAWQALESLKTAIAHEFLLQISDYVALKNIESLLTQTQNIQITLDHIHSAASVFDENEDTVRIHLWERKAKTIREHLEPIQGFDNARKRLGELAQTIKNAPGQQVTDDQAASIYQLLGEDANEKLEHLRVHMSNFQNIELVVQNLLHKNPNPPEEQKREHPPSVSETNGHNA